MDKGKSLSSYHRFSFINHYVLGWQLRWGCWPTSAWWGTICHEFEGRDFWGEKFWSHWRKGKIFPLVKIFYYKHKLKIS